jgi:hypothetical protein
MRVESLHLHAFKRFTDLRIDEIPESARVVVMVGPNGSGKSSVFDGFLRWRSRVRNLYLHEEAFHSKSGLPPLDWPQGATVTLHGPEPTDEEGKRKALYLRTAYRHEPRFRIDHLESVPTPVMDDRIERSIDTDVSVSRNYTRLVSRTLSAVFDSANDEVVGRDIREALIGRVRTAMTHVFGDLLLEGINDPLVNGTFVFEKGISRGFEYQNLSGGEKAAFDLLLDLVVATDYFDDSIICIDEPELHMHSKLQGLLFEEMVRLVPPNSQLWLASHSIGMMKSAKEVAANSPDSIAFLDFGSHNFDEEVVMTPAKVDRNFWRSTLEIALGDLSALVAPARIVLCEGKPRNAQNPLSSGEFDAKCYRRIFGSRYPDTDFLSVGNATDVETDRLGIGASVQAIVPGTEVVRVIDRDDRSADEIAALEAEGVRVLTRRHIESYLLDDEIIERLCVHLGHPDRYDDVIALREEAVRASVARGNPHDDFKSAAGDFFVKLTRTFGLTGHGNDFRAYLSGTIAALLTPDTAVYAELERGIFM